MLVDRDGRRVPPPGPRGLHAKLRQRRVLLAAGLAAIEFLAWRSGTPTSWRSCCSALLAVPPTLHRRQLPQGAARGRLDRGVRAGLLALVVVAIAVTSSSCS